MIDDPDAIVADAEREAQEAQELADALAVKVRSGDDSVTLEQIEKQRSLVSFLRLKAEGAQAKAAEIRRGARTKALKELRAELDEYAANAGHILADKLRVMQAAEDEFLAAANEHNRRLHDWGRRAGALHALNGSGRLVPPREDEGVAFDQARGVVMAGPRVIQAVEGDNLLKRLRAVSPDDRPEVFAGVERAASVTNEQLDKATHFYRNQSGVVMALDHEMPADEVKRNNLLQISRDEAVN